MTPWTSNIWIHKHCERYTSSNEFARTVIWCLWINQFNIIINLSWNLSSLHLPCIFSMSSCDICDIYSKCVLTATLCQSAVMRTWRSGWINVKRLHEATSPQYTSKWFSTALVVRTLSSFRPPGRSSNCWFRPGLSGKPCTRYRLSLYWLYLISARVPLSCVCEHSNVTSPS